MFRATRKCVFHSRSRLWRRKEKLWTRHMQAISSVCLIRVFSLSVIQSVHRGRNSGGNPTFAPEHFALVRQKDTMKRKQFIKGTSQIAQEGAIQIFQEFNAGMEEIIVGVVGVLQFDVLKYRLENEYNVEISWKICHTSISDGLRTRTRSMCSYY